MLQDEQPRHQPGRQRRLPHTRCAYPSNRPSRNFQSISRASRTSGWLRSMMSSSAGRNKSFRRSPRGFAIHPPTLMTHHRIAQIAENGNPKSPETRAQTCRFLQIRLLQPSRPPPLNGSAVLHGRPVIRRRRAARTPPAWRGLTGAAPSASRCRAARRLSRPCSALG